MFQKLIRSKKLKNISTFNNIYTELVIINKLVLCGTNVKGSIYVLRRILLTRTSLQFNF